MKLHPVPTTPEEVLDNARYHAGRGEYTAERGTYPNTALWPDEAAVHRGYIALTAERDAMRAMVRELATALEVAHREGRFDPCNGVRGGLIDEGESWHNDMMSRAAALLAQKVTP